MRLALNNLFNASCLLSTVKLRKNVKKFLLVLSSIYLFLMYQVNLFRLFEGIFTILGGLYIDSYLL